MVGRENLQNATALNSSLTNLARIIGPGIGGVIIAATSVTVLFLFNGLSFLAVLIALVLINTGELHAQVLRDKNLNEKGNAWKSLQEGMIYVWKTPAILLVILVVGLVLLFGSNFNVVLPLFASDVLHVGAAGFGSLSATSGIGALMAAIWLVWSNKQPSIRQILIFTLVFGVIEAVFSISRFYPISLLLLAVVGFAESAFASQATTLIQVTAPDHLRGRVMSVYVLFFDGSLPMGYL